MYRKILITLLVLLILAGAATAQDSNTWCWDWEEDCHPKAVLAPIAMTSVGGLGSWAELHWGAPEKKPDGYRISWAINGRWRSWKKPNTETRGNAFVDGDTLRYTIRGLSVPAGKTLRIRIRARYRGEKNGPWGCCLDLGD